MSNTPKTRLEALEALFEAACGVQLSQEPRMNLETLAPALAELNAAINAVHALPATPAPAAAGEVVEVRVAVIRNPRSGLLHVSGAQNNVGEWFLGTPTHAIAILTAHVLLPTIPTIPATVTPPKAAGGEG